MAEVNRLEELKYTRKMITNVFGLLHKGLYPGEVSEPLVDARKFVDQMYKSVQADIDLYEPRKTSEPVKLEVVEANESAAVEANGSTSDQAAV